MSSKPPELTKKEFDFLKSVGGKPIAKGRRRFAKGIEETTAWNFGLIVDPSVKGRQPDELTMGEEQINYDAEAKKEMPRFSIKGTYKDVEKALLWELRPRVPKHEEIFRVFFQETGSCVGNGVGQAVRELSLVEVHRKGDPELVLLPFYLLPYGKSREYAGLRGRGEGSWGTSAAKAIRQDGILPADTEGLEKWTVKNGGITWGRNAELKWSDGAAIEAKWLEKSRVHLVKTTALIKNTDEAFEALINGYSMTLASNWGGMMQCQVQGEPGVLMNRRTGVWNHQMCCIGGWQHPSLGLIFFILNSWGDGAHGTCPSGAPKGGFWIKASDFQNIIDQDEVFAFSQFQGFPAQEIDWFA